MEVVEGWYDDRFEWGASERWAGEALSSVGLESAVASSR